MKTLNLLFIFTLIFSHGCGYQWEPTYTRYENPPGSGIPMDVFYRDQANCEARWQDALDHGQIIWAKKLIMNSCMAAYKAVDVKY